MRRMTYDEYHPASSPATIAAHNSAAFWDRFDAILFRIICAICVCSGFGLLVFGAIWGLNHV